MTFYQNFLEEVKRRGLDCGIQNRQIPWLQAII